MNKLLSLILSQSTKQENLFTICKILSYGGPKNTFQITESLERADVYLDKNSNVLYKYLKKLLDLEIIEIRKVEKKVKFYELKRDFQLDAMSSIANRDGHFLLSLKKTLSRYKNFPFNDFIDDIIKNSHIENDADNFLIIDFESPDNYTGNKFLDFFYYKILDCDMAKFNYQKFEANKPKEIILKPYLIKEYNKRWYVIGQKESDNDFLTFPLDRIQSVNNVFSNYFERDCNFEPKEFWKHSLGIFRGDPSKVSFEVKDTKMKNIDFLKTAKIHSSQKEIMIDDQWMRVELEVFPSYELVREIRKLGVHNIRNIQPDNLNKMIRVD